MEIYEVGGCVRDKLLGNIPKDIDYVIVGSKEEDLIKLGFKKVSSSFPVFKKEGCNDDYCMARKEVKDGNGYKGFKTFHDETITLEEDLYRRDLTINAMAFDKDGNLIDPCNGYDDLKNGILKHVSGHFAEDPIRVLRTARFASRYNFKIHESTLELMKNIVKSNELDFIVSERIFLEIDKALGENYPWIFFEILHEVGALKVILPEVDILFGIPQPEKYHPEICTGKHIMLCLQEGKKLNCNNPTMFSILLHDVGKGLTNKEILPHHYEHEKKGIPVVESICERLKVPSYYKELSIMVCKKHTVCHSFNALNPKTIIKFLTEVNAYKNINRFKDFLLACESDAKGRTGYESINYSQSKDFIDILNLTLEVNIDYESIKDKSKIKEIVYKERLKKLKSSLKK